MSGINKAILIGNLGRDPELRYTGTGTAVCNFSIATSESYTDRSGDRVERTEWHRIVTWDKTAEHCAQYLKKGRKVYVEGRITLNEWEDKEGAKRHTTEIVAQTVQFLSPQSDGGGQGGGYSSNEPPPAGDGDIPF